MLQPVDVFIKFIEVVLIFTDHLFKHKNLCTDILQHLKRLRFLASCRVQFSLVLLELLFQYSEILLYRYALFHDSRYLTVYPGSSNNVERHTRQKQQEQKEQLH